MSEVEPNLIEEHEKRRKRLMLALEDELDSARRVRAYAQNQYIQGAKDFWAELRKQSALSLHHFKLIGDGLLDEFDRGEWPKATSE